MIRRKNLYVIIRVVLLCGIISICGGMSPSVSIKNKTIRTLSIPDNGYLDYWFIRFNFDWGVYNEDSRFEV